MTGQADGTVYINSKLDASGLKPGSKEIEAACRRAANSVKGMGDAANIAVQKMVNAFVRQNQMYAQQKQKVKELEKTLEEMSNQKVETEAFKNLSKELDSAEKQLDKFYGDLRRIESTKGLIGSATIKNTEKDIDALREKIRQLKIEERNATGGKAGIIGKEIGEYEQQLNDLIQKLADMKSKNEQIKNSYPYKKATEQIGIYSQKVDELRQKMEELRASGKDYEPVDTSAITNKLIAETDRLGQMNSTLGVSYDALKYRIEQYGGTMSGLINRHALLRKSFDSVYGAVKYGVSIVGNVAQKAYNGFLKTVNKLKNAMSGLQKETKKTNNSLNLSIKTLLKYGLGIRSLFVLFNKIRGAIKEGFGNLAQYSDKTNASLSALKSSLAQLKNSLATAFNPILSVIAPILSKFINMLSQAITYVGMFFAALTGQKSFTKAVGVQESYAESLEDTADAAKEAKKYLSGLDEIQRYTEDKDTSSKGGGAGGISPSDMFEEVTIPQKILDFADKVKDILSKLFEPLKKAWEQEGQFVMDAWKYALDEVWKLIKDIGRDFLTVWQEDKTVAIFANILHIIGDIGLVVGHLARNFREAWNTNEVGLNILRNIRDVIGIIVQHIRNMADATVEWADKLNFYPILDAFERFLKSIEPVVDAIWGIIEDFYTKVLLPLSKWTLEKGLPELLQVFIDFNNKVNWAALRANLAEFWEHLEPFAETVGEGLIIFIRRVSDALANFLNSKEFKDFLVSVENWMDKVTPQDVADALEMIAKSLIALKVALLGYEALKGISTVLTTIKTFLSFFGAGGGAAGVGTAMESVAGSAGILSKALGTLATAIAGLGIFDIAIKNPLFDLMEAMGASSEKIDFMREKYGKLGGTIDIVKDTMSVAKNTLQGYGAVISDTSQLGKALEKAMNDIAKGTIYTDEHLAQLKERFGATDDDIEMLRQSMLDTNDPLRQLADNFGLFDASAETLQDVQQGMKLLEDGTLTAADAFKEFSKPMWGMNDAALEFFQTLSDSGMTFDEYKASLENTSGAVQQFSSDVVEASANIGEGLNAGMESVDTDSPAQGFFSRLVESIKSIFGIHSPASTMMPFGENILLGVLEGFKSQFELFYESVSQLLDQISLKLTEGWESMKQTAIETWESVKESVLETWENIKESAAEKWEEIKEEISTKLEDTKEKITSTIDDAKQKWSDGWENMREKVSSIIESIKEILGSAFEWISEKVAAIGEKISSIGSGISGAIGGALGISGYSMTGIQIPVTTVPSIPQIATTNIPYLATGAVIPANAPFLAMLGDQKNGKNLELPEKLLREVIQDEFGKMLGNRQIVVRLEVDKKVLYQKVIEEAKLRQTVTGRNGFMLT